MPRNVCQQLNIIKMADVSDNRFNVLRENDDVEDLDDSVSQAITTAVLAVVEDSKTVKGTPKTNGKTRATTGNKIDGATIGDIVSQVVLAIQPVLIKAVTSAVTTATRQLMTDMATKTAGRKAELDGLKKEVQLHTFELNRLEQYSRHESIRICGIDETAGEDGRRCTVAGGRYCCDVEAGRHQHQPHTTGTTTQHTTHHREVCAQKLEEKQEEAA